MAITRVGQLTFDVDADGRVLERSIRRIGKQAGLVGGKEAGKEFNSSFSDSLSNLGQDALTKLRARSRRQGAQAGTITGTTFAQSMDRAIKGRLNGISDTIARVFTFNGNDGFERWRQGFDSVGDAADKMAENLDFARDEGRLTAAQYDKLRVKLDEYTDSAYKVEQADAQMLLNRRRLREETTRLNTIMGSNDSFDRYVKQSGGLSRALDTLRERMRRVNEAGDDDSWMIRMSSKLDGLSVAYQKNSDAADEHQKNMGRNGRLIKSHVGRTIAAWTALVLAIGEGTATLGSGVGASLTALISSIGFGLVGAIGLAGTALSGLVVQAGLAINALRFMKDQVPGFQTALDNLANASEVAGKRFADAWGPSVARLLDTITGLFENTAIADAMAASLSTITDSFTAALNSPGFQQFYQALATTIPTALTSIGTGFAQFASGLASIFAGASPALVIFADHFNTWATNFATTMSEMAADGRLQDFFTRALESMEKVFGVVGALTGALMTLFEAGAPSGNRLLQHITDLLNRWNEWMESIEGQKALEEWFANGEKIFMGLLDLAGDLGLALGQLVTPESIDRLLRFMDGLGDFLPIAAQILEFFGRLDILNLFVTILNTIGALLTPIMPVLLDFASLIGEQLIDGVERLAPKFADLGVILAPILEKFAVLAEKLLPVVIDIIIGVIDVVISIIDTFTIFDQAIGNNKEALGIWGDVLGTIFGIVGGIITGFLIMSSGIFKTIAALLKGDFSGAFKIMEDTVRGVFEALGLDFDGFIQWMTDIYLEADKFLGKAAKEFSNFQRDVGKAIDGVIGWIRDAIGWFGSLFGAANNASGASSRARTSAGQGGASGRAFASGGILNGPRRILAGEAGPEAIVPLRRNLSQVDPSVRWLSALAQDRRMASGGVVGGSGKTLNVAPGAIVVQEVADGRKTANDVLTRLVEHAAG